MNGSGATPPIPNNEAAEDQLKLQYYEKCFRLQLDLFLIGFWLGKQIVKGFTDAARYQLPESTFPSCLSKKEKLYFRSGK